MSEKSQKTEAEMLDQTFGTYDADMTAETETATVQSNNAPSSNSKKSMNSNLLIAGGIGLAAVALIGVKFMGGSNEQSQQPAEVAILQPATPVQQAAVNPPVTAPVESITVTPTVNPDTSAAAQYLSNNNPLAPTTPKVEEVKAPVVPEPEKVESNATAVVPVSPKVVTVQTVTEKPAKVDVTNNPNVVANNASQAGLTNELKSLFERQTQEIKGAVENVGNRVDKLERTVARQETTNRNIEERLSSLESGKVAVIKPVKTETVSNDEAPKAKKVVAKKYVMKKPKKVKHVENSTSVLVDKTATTVVTKVETVYPTLDIHSVYGNRIWTKNKDGSLSTYTVGERLPSGEVIKKIDDDKFKVTTDKRVLTK